MSLARRGGVWKGVTVMKMRFLVLTGAVMWGAAVSPLLAQYQSPRQYLRRLDPNAAPRRPAAPNPSPLPPGPVVTPPPAVPATPAVTGTNTARQTAAQLAAQARALELLRKRAEAGSASDQYELGMRYLTGRGLQTNPVEAARWLGAAARQDHYWARKKLEELKELGMPWPEPAPAPAPPAGAEAAPAAPAAATPASGAAESAPAKTAPPPAPERP